MNEPEVIVAADPLGGYPESQPPKRATTAERFGTARDWRKRLVPLQHNRGEPLRAPRMPVEQYRAMRKAVKKTRRQLAAGQPVMRVGGEGE
jgi:hypothetical protein